MTEIETSRGVQYSSLLSYLFEGTPLSSSVHAAIAIVMEEETPCLKGKPEGTGEAGITGGSQEIGEMGSREGFPW
jgi:hypothetical protein